MHEDLSYIMDEYCDVFPEKLPKGIPPNRDNEFAIELVPDAKQQSREIYSMFQLELEEVPNKITELVEQGIVRPTSSLWGAPDLFATKKGRNLLFSILLINIRFNTNIPS